MKKLHGLRLSLLFTALLFLLASCGKAQEETPQSDSEHAIYVAESLKNSIGGTQENFSVTEDHLYFLQSVNNETNICRIPLSDIDGETDFSQSESILTPTELLANLPEGAPTTYNYAAILDCATDSEQNLYCLAALYKSGINSTLLSGILYKQSPEGLPLYSIALPDLQTPIRYADLMAVDPGGRAFVLLGSSILTVDENGQGGTNISLEDDLAPDRNIAIRLLAGGEGRIYCTVENSFNYTRNTYILNEPNHPQPAKVLNLSGTLGMNLHESPNGLLVQSNDDKLYRYDQKTDSLQEVLTWGDSDLVGNDIQRITQLTENSFLTFSRFLDQETLLLLSKTPLSELPRKEQIVIVSFSPDTVLKQSVAEFNRTSSQYRVSIETYGADAYGIDDNADAFALLNANLSSKNGPDILDLSSLGFGPYADDNLLEDLRPYIDNDNLISIANYPDNLLKGYTINGKLLCIPTSFYFRPLWAIGPRTASVQDWTIPEIMALTERYPDAPLFDPPRQDGESILESLCAPYLLEHFVNWEKGESDFDSEEFRNMLVWVKAQAEKPVSEAETGLIADSRLSKFIDFFSTAWNYNEDAIIRGCPSADGEGYFSAIACNALGIVSGSKHKEGAWEFLRHFLSGDDYEPHFPTRTDLLEALAEEAVTPRYCLDEKGNRLKDSEGKDWILPKGQIYINGEPFEFFALEQSQADAVMAAMAKIDFSPRTVTENTILEIVGQEARDFFQGRKTPEQVSAVIQSRVQTLLQENR